MPLDSCLLFGVCLIMMNIAFHIVRVRINCQYITQSNIINECSIKFQYSYSVNNTTPYTLIVEILRGNRHVAGINFVDGYVGFPPRHGFMISEKKRINICDTNTFTNIATVAAKGVPDQVKCTHEMEF